MTILTIDVDTLKSKMDAQSDLCLIDVRELNEWDEAHIPGALHIPKGELPTLIENTVPNKTTPVYLQCKSGGRSTASAMQLLEMGYQEVYSVDGGITAWAMAGFPIVK